MTPAPLLEARGIRRAFGHVQALDGADFTLYRGEICALVGDNGAGKSTLVKILSGVDRPDAGQILLDGNVVDIASPAIAQRLGISTVYQDLALAPELSAAENLFLGRELSRGGVLGALRFVDRHRMELAAVERFAALGIALASQRVPVASLSGGQQQSVAIARAAMWAGKVIFMDEPTAALGVVQTGRVLDLIRQVRANGLSVVLISHNMPHVLEVADRIEVLRAGRRVAQYTAAEASLSRLVAAMTAGGSEYFDEAARS